MMDPHAYSISVRRAEFDSEVCFEARVRELPDVTEYADSAEEAYALAIDAIEITSAMFSEKGRIMPAPQEFVEDYSGRVTLRLPKTLHRALADAADDEGVSLNQHLVNVLSYFSGFAAAHKQPESASWYPVEKSLPQKSHRSRLTLVHSQEIEREPLWDKAG